MDVSSVERTIGLATLSHSEYMEFVDLQIAEFAEQKVRAGHWRQDEASARSRDAVMSLLAKAGPRPGHRCFKGVDPFGRRVGWVWMGPPPEDLHLEGARWLYQITVDEGLRGQGFGRALLVAAEDLLAAEGASALYLNVFAWNTAARALYESAGYEVHHDGGTEFGMHKRLRPR